MVSDPQGDLPAERDGGGVNVLEMLVIIAKRRCGIAKFTVLVSIAAVVIVMLMPDIYTARAVIMPPQQDQPTAALIVGQLGGLAGGGISPADLGLKNPNDLYVGVLKSRTIADRLIERFKLKELYNEETLVGTRRQLEKKSNVYSGKDGLVYIEFDDEDAKRAAQVANAYAEELELLTRRLAISEASKRRIFFEQRIVETRKGLEKVEQALKVVQEETGLIKLDDQARAIFEAVAGMKAQVALKEVQLDSMRTFATPKNPDFMRAQEELLSLRKQLSVLERQQQGVVETGIMVPTGKMPEAGLEYLRRLRDVKYQEAVLDLVSKQYELAKIDEGKNPVLIQAVDNAVAPDRKTKPWRSLIVGLATVLAAMLAMWWAFLAESLSRGMHDAGQVERVELMRGYLLEDAARLRGLKEKLLRRQRVQGDRRPD